MPGRPAGRGRPGTAIYLPVPESEDVLDEPVLLEGSALDGLVLLGVFADGEVVLASPPMPDVLAPGDDIPDPVDEGSELLAPASPVAPAELPP